VNENLLKNNTHLSSVIYVNWLYILVMVMLGVQKILVGITPKIQIKGVLFSGHPVECYNA